METNTMQNRFWNKPLKISTKNSDVHININNNDKIRKTSKETLDDIKKI